MAENRLVLRNVAWNSIGLGLPLLVALAAFPFLIDGLGVHRFGVLALAWMVVGYFSIFDLGLGRALTKVVAEKRGPATRGELPAVIYTALLLMVGLGVAGAMVFWHLAPWLVGDVLDVPSELRVEATQAFQILSVSIPVVVVSAGLTGVLEAHQRFGLVNAIRLPIGLGTFLVPLAVLPYSPSLVPITIALVCIRFAACLAYALMCLAIVKELRNRVQIVATLIPGLLRVGGWMTVSNLISPLMVYLDRFVIGAMLSVSSVTYYTTPYEVVTRAWLLPRAVMGVLFPEFSFTLARNPLGAADLYERWTKFVFLLMFPFTLVVVTLAYELLDIWIGAEFAERSSRVLQLLAAGVLINSLAQISFGLIQGAGRADITAKIHVLELPFYLLALWWGIDLLGITGAALVWMLRVFVDAILLFYYSRHLLVRRSVVPEKSLTIILLLSSLILPGAFAPDLVYKILYIAIALAVFAVISWRYLLHTEDRLYLAQRFSKLTGHRSA